MLLGHPSHLGNNQSCVSLVCVTGGGHNWSRRLLHRSSSSWYLGRHALPTSHAVCRYQLWQAHACERIIDHTLQAQLYYAMHKHAPGRLWSIQGPP